MSEKKEKYFEPDIEVVLLELADIITASAGELGKDPDEDVDDDGWT